MEPDAHATEVTDKRPRETYLLPDGTPGLILSSMVGAQRTVGEAGLLNDGQGVAASAVIDAARKALTDNGVALMFTATDVNNGERKTKNGSQPFTTMTVKLRFIAADGTSIGHTFPAGGSAFNNKHVQAAVTAGIKSALRHVLMMSVETQQERATKPSRVSKELLAYIKHMHRQETIDELRTANAHPTFDALKPSDMAPARDEYRERMDQIDRLNGSGWRAKEIKDQQNARAVEREKAGIDAARVESQSPPRGKPIDPSATRPMTEDDRRKR